jgi:hypothetical protein
MSAEDGGGRRTEDGGGGGRNMHSHKGVFHSLITFRSLKMAAYKVSLTCNAFIAYLA